MYPQVWHKDIATKKTVAIINEWVSQIVINIYSKNVSIYFYGKVTAVGTKTEPIQFLSQKQNDFQFATI